MASTPGAPPDPVPQGSRGPWWLLKETYNQFCLDSAPRLAAALAYYTLFSITPLLLMLVSVAGLFTQRSDVEAGLMRQVTETMGPTAAAAVQGLIRASSSTSHGIMASVFGVVAMVVGAVGFFSQLQESLNIIWGVQLRLDLTWKNTVLRRLYCFVLVVVGGIVLLASQVAAAYLAAATAYVQERFASPPWVWQCVNLAVSVGFTSLLFAAIFFAVPDAEIHWSDVRIGAFGTGLLFSLAQMGLAFYLGRSTSSTYGAAASLVVLLLWCYYSAQILFFGAEFTKVWAKVHGHGVTPRKHAVLR